MGRAERRKGAAHEPLMRQQDPKSPKQGICIICLYIYL